MKNSNRILTVIFIISTFGAILTFKYLMNGLFPSGELAPNFNALFYLGAVFFVLAIVFAVIFYIKFLKLQSFNAYVFFMTMPLNLLLFFSFYFLTYLSSTSQNGTLQVIKLSLNLENNSQNTYWWFTGLGVFYLILMYFMFALLTRPLKRVQKASSRLGDGIVNSEILIGGSRQFKDIEFSLNKINQNYKRDANVLKQTNLEVEKFVPKQFLHFFGVNNILELDLGNSVQKEMTTLFCDIKNSLKISSSLSLEENFQFINAYLNLISPLIRRYNGFVDKYLGDGIMAVFQKPEHALECTKSIFNAVTDINFKQKQMPSMKVEVSVHTGEVVFGVVGEENRKSLTVLSDGVSLASKLSDVNKFFSTRAVFSKRTLNALPYGFQLNYRYVGTLKSDTPSGESFGVFENLDIYSRIKREKLINLKGTFEQGVRLYEDGDYQTAKLHFENVLKKFKDDHVAFVYLNVCDEKLKFKD
jgi:class 3 adenylate cyclase